MSASMASASPRGPCCSRRAKRSTRSSVFGYQMRFDLNQGFPMVTTKKVAFNALVHELLWFLSGSTNIGTLKQHNVTIWDEWADENGDARSHLRQAVAGLGGARRPDHRPGRLPAGGYRGGRERPHGLGRSPADPLGLEPGRLAEHVCAGLSHAGPVLVTQGRLSCQLYQRSADSFLGVPFNIASYALLTHLRGPGQRTWASASSSTRSATCISTPTI